MAVVTTPKFGLKTYTAGADAHPTRTEFNAMIASIEDWGATAQKGLASARPTAGQEGRFYWATDSARIYYDDGVVWQDLSTNGGGGAGAAIVVGGSGAEGSGSRSARSDHTHPLPLATSSVNGAMPMLDKAKLDNAVSVATASRLVIRDSSGRAQFGDPAVAADVATKGYTDTGLSGKSNVGHTHTYSEITDTPTTNAPIAWNDVLYKPSTFPPTIGTTVTTAKAGNYVPAWSEVTSKPSSFPSDWGSVSGKPASFPAVVGTTVGVAKPGEWLPTWSEVSGKPSTFAPVIGTTSTTAKAGNYVPAWSEVSSKPTTFTPSTHSHDWADILGKPSTFTPSAHTHNVTEIVGQPDFATQKTFNDYMYDQNNIQAAAIGTVDGRVTSTYNYATTKLTNGDYAVWHDASGISSQATFNTNAAYTGQFRAMWVHQDGRFGYNLSSRKFKTNERDYVKPLELLKTMGPKWFQYKADVETLGTAAAPWRANFIAEDLFDNDLKEFVSYDGEGTAREDVHTINESFLVTTLWSFCQQLQSAVEDLQKQILELK